jgi:hypothetical protein
LGAALASIAKEACRLLCRQLIEPLLLLGAEKSANLGIHPGLVFTHGLAALLHSSTHTPHSFWILVFEHLSNGFTLFRIQVEHSRQRMQATLTTAVPGWTRQLGYLTPHMSIRDARSGHDAKRENTYENSYSFQTSLVHQSCSVVP